MNMIPGFNTGDFFMYKQPMKLIINKVISRCSLIFAGN
jgi:hypothetical protein